MKSTRALLYIYAIIILFAAETQAQNKLQDAINNICVGNIKRHLGFLGSDVFEGRATGSIGSALSAKYLAFQFEQYGLLPGGDNNTFYQYIPMHGNKPLPDTELNITANNKNYKLKLNEDYFIYGAGDRRYIPNKAQLVFAGYGIIAPEYDYNDYEQINVEGKIALILDGEPYSDDPDYFDGEGVTVYSYSGSKQRLALSRGAIGTIIIPAAEGFSQSELLKKKMEFSFEDVYLAYSVTSSLNVLMNPAFADSLLKHETYRWPDILAMHDRGVLKSFDLNAFLTFKSDYTRRDFIEQNILGEIKGSDPALNDKVILVTSHYDHLGIGIPVNGDSVYNGVFDNAIGNAVLLEISRLISEYGLEPSRSLLFMMVTGEEKGLLGSRYYVDYPKYPLYKTTANINIDGIPFIDRFKSVVAFGYNQSSLSANIDRVCSEMNLRIDPVPAQFSISETFNRSDQIAFANAGIPSVLLMDGIDYETVTPETGLRKLMFYSSNIYHTPFDDLTQVVNYDAVKQYIELLLRLIMNTADDENEPEWNSGSIYKMARLRSIAERK